MDSHALEGLRQTVDPVAERCWKRGGRSGRRREVTHATVARAADSGCGRDLWMSAVRLPRRSDPEDQRDDVRSSRSRCRGRVGGARQHRRERRLAGGPGAGERRTAARRASGLARARRRIRRREVSFPCEDRSCSGGACCRDTLTPPGFIACDDLEDPCRPPCPRQCQSLQTVTCTSGCPGGSCCTDEILPPGAVDCRLLCVPGTPWCE